MSTRLIALDDKAAWDAALDNLPHSHAHTHWYNEALAKSLPHPVALFAYEAADGRAVLPLQLRDFHGETDVATPYGFSGFACTGPCDNLASAWESFARAQKFICGYLALHPVFSRPIPGAQPGRTVYLQDLTPSEDELLAHMNSTHRYEIRRDNALLPSIIHGVHPSALIPLYAATRSRVGASGAYAFNDETMRDWLASRSCFTLGIEEEGALLAAIVCMHTQAIGDYFINASTDSGRKYTRLLAFAMMLELKRRNVPLLNLGGGALEGDALDDFKRRFGGRAARIDVVKQIYDPARFDALCSGKPAKPGFFPPYRAA